MIKKTIMKKMKANTIVCAILLAIWGHIENVQSVSASDKKWFFYCFVTSLHDFSYFVLWNWKMAATEIQLVNWIYYWTDSTFCGIENWKTFLISTLINIESEKIKETEINANILKTKWWYWRCDILTGVKNTWEQICFIH